MIATSLLLLVEVNGTTCEYIETTLEASCLNKDIQLHGFHNAPQLERVGEKGAARIKLCFLSSLISSMPTELFLTYSEHPYTEEFPTT